MENTYLLKLPLSLKSPVGGWVGWLLDWLVKVLVFLPLTLQQVVGNNIKRVPQSTHSKWTRGLPSTLKKYTRLPYIFIVHFK